MLRWLALAGITFKSGHAAAQLAAHLGHWLESLDLSIVFSGRGQQELPFLEYLGGFSGTATTTELQRRRSARSTAAAAAAGARRCNLRSRGAQSLAEGLAALQRFHLRGNHNIGAAGVGHLLSMQLTELDVPYCRLDGDALLSLTVISSLRQLNVGGSSLNWGSLDRSGSHALEAMPRLLELEHSSAGELDALNSTKAWAGGACCWGRSGEDHL